ncbi:MAG: aldehyde dehydrogenase (NADP(+)) [Phycisphaeraceae bacterium]|nr:aldehyde dehydrogenase (NADP(+)) [Phycisphaeraceae bacterium]
MPLHGKNIIGNTTSALGSDTVQAINPASGARIDPPFHDATQEEIDDALRRADEAFSRRPEDPARTVDLLQRAADGIEALGDELIERCGAETGLPAPRLEGERARTCNQLRMFARIVDEGSWVDARIDHAIPDRAPLPKPDMRRMLAPLGPVLVFGASNFPLAFSVAGGDTASAFAAGCPVIVKARPAHPGTAELVAQAVQKACADVGMPDGWFSMVHGPGRTTGACLVRHPVIQAVGFTGSLSGGRTLFDLAAQRPQPIPVYAEMGSINPVFFLAEALESNPEGLAEAMHQSVTLGVGQFCTNPGLAVAVESAALNRFVDELSRRIEQTEPATMLLGEIRESYVKGTDALGGAQGVRLAAQSAGSPDRARTQCAAAVFTTDADAFCDNPELSEEVFGPATMVVRCRDAAQMLGVARRLEGQLTATIHATEREITDQQELLRVLTTRAGRVLFGGFPTGLEVCSATHHGGPYPATTDGRTTSVGTAAIERFTRAICYQNFPAAQLPPALRDDNPLDIWRLVDDVRTRDAS